MSTLRGGDRAAARAALTLRSELGLPATEPVCVYDAAEQLGVDVRFIDTPSLEGMYVRGSPPVILVSVHRPSGRQAMTCAHEVGHHRLGHGTSISQYLAAFSPRTSEERQAHTFAGHFLMPLAAVLRGFKLRNGDASNPSAECVYETAGWLGVGYTALLYHMHAVLGLLPEVHYRALERQRPSDVRARLAGAPIECDLYVVGSEWTGRPVDLRVGDIALVSPTFTLEGQCASLNGNQVKAVRPGIGRLVAADHSWAAFLRVSRSGYTGLGAYRHLDDEYE